MKKKICVILTGGTICSLPGTNGKNHSDAEKTQTRLTYYYLKESDSPYKDEVEFDIKSLNPDILSENMTAWAWDELLKIFREQVDFDKYRGIIVLHGTDTLAYTSAFLSFALAGIKIPVCMVSAQLRLGTEEGGEWIPDKRSNGYANFRAAVELIMNRIEANVYAVYRNESNEQNGEHEAGELLVHYGSDLIQCPNESNNFHSRSEMKIPDPTNAKLRGKPFESSDRLYLDFEETDGEVLMLRPYTNLNYGAINLDGFSAVIHGTYHSESVCIGRPKQNVKRDGDDYAVNAIKKTDRPYSILTLLSRCKSQEIPVFLAPCNPESAKYGTTANALYAGALPIAGITLEAAYAKAVLGCSLGKRGKALYDFLKAPINHEFAKISHDCEIS